MTAVRVDSAHRLGLVDWVALEDAGDQVHVLPHVGSRRPLPLAQSLLIGDLLIRRPDINPIGVNN